MAGDDVVIASENVRCIISPYLGGRISSIVAFGRELLITKNGETNLQKWGCYPMAPWAGRVRNGVFIHDTKQHNLEINMPPHAIHGTVLDRPWETTATSPSSVKMQIDLGSQWGFSGEVTQNISVVNDTIKFELNLSTNDATMPGQVGWHPWFARPCTFTTNFEKMYVRDASGIPSGEMIAPTSGPFDDCFTDSRQAPVIQFENNLRVEIQSDCTHWVVYDEPQHAICIEPQSGPPDGFNLEPHVITPKTPLSRYMRLIISA